MNTNHELRSGLKWTVNECLRLEREYDLLKLSVEEIALLHQRSPYAIMYKLDVEGIADFNELYQQTYPNEASNEESESEDSESEINDEDEDEESYQEQDQELAGDESESDDDVYDKYDLRKQVGLLTKQLSNLTAIVYKSLIKGSPKSDELFH
jgi:hypothetical protein